MFAAVFFVNTVFRVVKNAIKYENYSLLNLKILYLCKLTDCSFPWPCLNFTTAVFGHLIFKSAEDT